MERLRGAFREAQEALRGLRASMASVSVEVAGVLDAHIALLGDAALHEQVEERIRERSWSPEWALSAVIEEHARRLHDLGDGYLSQRAADLTDIRRRVLRVLLGRREEELARLPGQVIVVARDLAPSQTAALDPLRVAGFVTDAGGPTSHTAIIARSLGIPAVVGLGDLSSSVPPGARLIVDGSRGQVVIDPDPPTLRRYLEIQRDFGVHLSEVARVRHLPAETLDGHGVRMLANVEFPEEIPSALDAGAEGIGLYRTEFLVRPGAPLPTERDHLRAYREAAARLDGRPLTIRTLDLGADKVNPDPDAAAEPNPFLGRRSLRLCLERPDLFVPQVRAILQASAHGNLRVLLPMVGSVADVRRAREVFDTERTRLRREGVHLPPDLPIGVMVEIPSAALTSDVLARHADFLSIGTNDLIQYTLAVDRINPRVASLYEPAHPAVLRLVSRVAAAAREEGVEVSVCGEMSGDPLYAFLLLGLGLRVLSMNARSIPEVKRVIRAGTMEVARDLVEEVRMLREGVEIEGHLRGRMRELVPVLF